LQLTVHDSAKGFLAAAAPFLKTSEAETSMMIIAASRMMSAPAGDDAGVYLGSVEHDGAIVAAALLGGDGGMMLTAAPAPALTLFAADMSSRRRAPRSMVGPLDACEAFAREWAARTGRRHALRFHLLHYELRRRPSPQPSAARGRMRAPTPAEHALLVSWQLAFIGEINLADDSVRAQRVFARRLAQGAVRVWDDVGVVALAGYGDGGTDVARIAPVFTPPEHRRRSYASTLVGELSRELFDAGKRAVFLTADASNPTSNSIYRRLGFVPAAEHYHFDFLPPP
jgi:GNAT superfamily N-acetyltransferase